jgi:hypothetical protein
MGMRKLTIWILGIVTALLLIWDVLAYAFGENATISVAITDWSYYTPWVPFAFGVLMGHWFFPPKRSQDK